MDSITLKLKKEKVEKTKEGPKEMLKEVDI
jgi:hypothetical protein